MESGDKALVILVALCIIAAVLFRGDPDLIQSVIDWINRH